MQVKGDATTSCSNLCFSSLSFILLVVLVAPYRLVMQNDGNLVLYNNETTPVGRVCVWIHMLVSVQMLVCLFGCCESQWRNIWILSHWRKVLNSPNESCHSFLALRSASTQNVATETLLWTSLSCKTIQMWSTGTRVIEVSTEGVYISAGMCVHMSGNPIWKRRQSIDTRVSVHSYELHVA